MSYITQQFNAMNFVAQQSFIFNNGLRLWYDFSQSNCFTSSGFTISNLNITPTYSGTFSGATFSNDNGGVFRFNGSGHRIGFRGTQSGTNRATWILWMKPNGNQQAFDTIWLCRTGGDFGISNVNGLLYTDQGTNTFALLWNDTSFRRSLGTIPANKWSMVGVSVGIANYSSYIYNDVDSGLKITLTYSVGPLGGPGTVQLTSTQSFNNPSMAFDPSFTSRVWTGDIGYALYYARDLSSFEIDSIYNLSKTRFGY
jgi:hypothetical protein